MTGSIKFQVMLKNIYSFPLLGEKWLLMYIFDQFWTTVTLKYFILIRCMWQLVQQKMSFWLLKKHIYKIVFFSFQM